MCLNLHAFFFLLDDLRHLENLKCKQKETVMWDKHDKNSVHIVINYSNLRTIKQKCSIDIRVTKNWNSTLICIQFL